MSVDALCRRLGAEGFGFCQLGIVACGALLLLAVAAIPIFLALQAHGDHRRDDE